MERILELIKSAGDGAFAIDREQRIVFWNDACERILGFEASEVVGRLCYEVIAGTAADGCAVCRRDCAAVLSRAEHEPMTSRHLSVPHKDGSKVWVGVSTILVPSSWNDLSILIHLIRDITVHKHIESLVAQLTGDVAQLTSTAGAAESHEHNHIAMTDRERQILQTMSTGKTSLEISEHLNISQATVRNHIHHILTKLGVRNRLEAVILGLRSGLL